MSTLRDEIEATLEPGDDYPDPDGVAEALCRHCRFPVVRKNVSTGRYFSPNWRMAWVHTDTYEVRCWAPSASPDREVTD